MSLIKCAECSHAISTEAKVCPGCGADNRHYTKPTSIVKVIVLGGLAIWTIVYFAEQFSGKGPSAAMDAPTEALQKWEYSSGEDPMRKANWYWASALSKEPLIFTFPYNKKDNRARLVIRSDPKNGRDILLTVDHGQFSCSSYDCQIFIKVDEQPVKEIKASPASSGHSNAVFLPYAQTLLALRKADRIMIETAFYGQGTRQMTFQVAGLEWKH